MCVNQLNVSIPMHIPPSSWINTEKNPDGQTRQPKMLFSFLVKKQLTAARWKWIMEANDTGVRQYSSCSVPGRWEKKTHTVWGLNDVSSTRVKTVCSCLICVSSSLWIIYGPKKRFIFLYPLPLGTEKVAVIMTSRSCVQVVVRDLKVRWYSQPNTQQEANFFYFFLLALNNEFHLRFVQNAEANTGCDVFKWLLVNYSQFLFIFYFLK